MAIPTLAMIPSGYKTNKVYSVLPTDGSGDLAFARTSTGTRVNSSGLIEEVGIGKPRLDYTDGSCPSLLLEPSSTNLITQSEAFDNIFWTKSGVNETGGFVSPSSSSPSGAFELVEDTSTGFHSCYNQINGSLNTFSFYAKYSGTQFVAISYDGGNNFNFFDILNGQLGTVTDSSHTSTITSVGNGWYRCSMYNGHTTFGATIWLSNDGIATSYTGDGTSGVYIFGAQLEEQSSPTSYIPTAGTTISRTKDAVSKSGISGLIGQTQGVVYVEFNQKTINKNDTRRIISLTDGTSNNRIVVYIKATNAIDYYVRNSGGDLFLGTSTSDYGNSVGKHKMAAVYKDGDYALYMDGNLIISGSGTSGTIPACNRIDVGSQLGASELFEPIKDVRLYNTRLSNSELVVLTTI